MGKPIVAVTMGDPAGVGPEVVLKALAHLRIRKACHPIVLGDFNILQRTQRRRRGYPFELIRWEKGNPLPKGEDTVPVFSLTNLSLKQSRPGHLSRSSGEAAYRYISAAVELVLNRTADAIATAPISKRALQLAGYHYPGHTEMLAEMTKTKECRMMLLGKRLKVVLITIHVPLARVARELSRKRIRVTLELTHQALTQYFHIPRPRLAVAGLNPHAGEGGLFGSEEIRIILPAVKDARGKGIRAYGPLPADSLFHQVVRGEYDAAICMYHDQGLGPLKLLHFSDGVNLTLGLPIIRTSVDHGTAYEIAGKNKADGSSMKEAILLASTLARQKKGG
jgi:4-hydroxythreonine-4-phosphate dehydrogenase